VVRKWGSRAQGVGIDRAKGSLGLREEGGMRGAVVRAREG
jgi:hypothetical protein